MIFNVFIKANRHGLRFLSVLVTIIFFGFKTFAQWNPDAGVVPSYALGATVITSSNTTGNKAVDNDMHTNWQSGGSLPVLPLGFLSRADLNILLGVGSTSECTSSGSSNPGRTTDSNLNVPENISASGGSAWVNYHFNAPTSLLTVSLKCNVTDPVQIYAYRTNGSPFLAGTITTADNFSVKRFSANLDSVTDIKLVSGSGFSLFEIGALADYPTEYLIVDLGQLRNVGFINTRCWSNGLSLGQNVISTKIYLSTDNVTYDEIGEVNPEALYAQVVRPDTITPARYVKVEHTLKNIDYAKAFVWEVQVYDKWGPYGAFPAAQARTIKNKDILGVNGIWGWGYNAHSDVLQPGQGPTKFNAIATHARNYHNLYWDVDDPDSIPNYGTMPFGLALWWLNWDREYGAWKNAGLKVQASIKFNEWQWQTRMAQWDNPYLAGYNYAYAFARHFGPTYGNGLVESYEAGNEPWTYPAAFYKEVMKGMLHGARDGDPALILLPCALQSSDPLVEDSVGGNYMGARIDSTDVPYIDALNVHHYSYTYDWDGTRIAVYPEHPESAMHAVVNDIRFRNANMPGTPIWLSEWGWDSEGVGQACTFGECVSELEQAVYAVRGAMMFTRLGLDRITWFFYGNGSGSGLYSRSGLVGSDTSNFAQEKRSFKAFAAYVNLLGDAYFLDVLREDDQAWIYLFGDSLGNPTHIAAWRPVDGNDVSVHPVNFSYNYMPDSSWIINGGAYLQPAPNPTYYHGTMKLMLTSAPLVVKLKPATNTEIAWTGVVNGNWDNPANWNPAQVPSALDDAVVPAGAPNYPVNYSSDPEVRSLIIEAGGQMTLVPNYDLTVHHALVLDGGTFSVTGIAGAAPEIHIKGNFENRNGIFNPGTGKALINGDLPQSVSGKSRFYNLEVTNTTPITLDDTMEISGIMNVTTGSTINSNGSLVIASGASLMYGNGTAGGGGDVLGNVTVKRNGHTNTSLWNYWSSPVTGASVHVIGSNLYQYDPYQATGTTLSELQRGWLHYSGTMMPGMGYISKGGGNVAFFGPVNNGPVIAPITVNVKKSAATTVGYNLIGNPFPSAISAAQFIAVNGPSAGGGNNTLTGALYFWDDDASGGSGYNFNDFAIWSSAGIVAGPNTGLTPDGNIASGQGFFVEKIANGNGQVQFLNSMRTTNNSIFFRNAPIQRLWLSVTNPANLYNETLLAFIDDATDSLDLLYDAKKMRGNQDLALYSKMPGLDLAIQALPLLTQDKIIPLGLEAGVSGLYTLNLKQTENLDETVLIWLEDTQTGTMQNLRLNPSYTFNIAAGNYPNRFFIHLTPPMNITVLEEGCDGEDGQIILDQPGSAQWNYILAGPNGGVVDAGVSFNGNLGFNGLSAGTYTLALTDNNGYQLTKAIEIKAVDSVTAHYLLINGHAYEAEEPIAFSNQSIAATAYEWDFGDGWTSTLENPVHAYTTPGTYEAILTASNADCQEVYSDFIYVSPKIATGILHVTDASPNVYAINKSVFVDLTPISEPVRIDIYNMVGQRIYFQNAESGKVVKIDLGVSEGIYIVKVEGATVKTFRIHIAE